MLVLLPPSEGKAASGRGAPLKPESLSLPGLADARAAVLDELVELCAGGRGEGPRGARASARACAARSRRTRSCARPGTRPAGEIYTGVLYDALGLATLDAAARAAGRAVAAGLLRAVGRGAGRRPDPLVPLLDGREAAGTGRAGRVLARADGRRSCREAAGDGLVLDLRSSAYAAAWKPTGEVAERTATVRVLHSRIVDGVEKRSVVSHFNKATKGRMVRDLLAGRGAAEGSGGAGGGAARPGPRRGGAGPGRAGTAVGARRGGHRDPLTAAVGRPASPALHPAQRALRSVRFTAAG